MSQKQNSDGAKINGNANKQITAKKRIHVKSKTVQIQQQQQQYVGLDVHKNFIQVAVMDKGGKVLSNTRVDNNDDEIRKIFAGIPKNAKCVMESSSVWYGLFRFISDSLKRDVILSNPFETKVIATSKKKTDKVDAQILADLLRGGYISACYVPSGKTVQNRQLTRHRAKTIQSRTVLKNQIHAILLQNRIQVNGDPFSRPWISRVRDLDNFRINDKLSIIDSINDRIVGIDMRIKSAVADSPDAVLLQTIPGFGSYTALTMASEIDGVDRFADSHKLCAYAGMVPSVRNSADTIHHGRITKRGSPMMRWLLVESVHSHVRHAPSDSPISVFYKRVAKKRGMSKAAVAAASKMLRISYWMLKKRMTFKQCIGDACVK